MTRIGQETYSSFEHELCGPTLVGLDSTWIMQIIVSILLVPLVILSLRAFKVIRYAVIVDDDFIPAF
jgi:hypothetical protein